MDRGDQPTFKSFAEELQYWREFAEKLMIE